MIAIGPLETVQEELLLRMLGDDGTLIPPASFLSVAERLGLVTDVDRWVIARAFDILAGRSRDRPPRSFAVNLSAKSIANHEILELIERQLAPTGIDPAALTFELTETAAIVNIDQARRFTSAVRSMGCRVALDDLGTGFASFHYLKHLDFDVVKIDGEFVRGLANDATNELVIRAIVDIAHALGKLTTAEFGDGPETLYSLQQLGVDYAQGFGIIPPRDISEDTDDAAAHERLDELRRATCRLARAQAVRSPAT